MKQCQNLLEECLANQLSEMQSEGTYKQERIILSPQGSQINTDTMENPGKSVLNMCSNNYLGWCNLPDIKAAGIKALEERGAGLSSVRFICGTQDIHQDLESKITQFHGGSDAILYNSCFDANSGFFEALFNREDLILSDSLNHASIIDGLRLCKAEKIKYKHSDMAYLDGLLQQYGGKSRFRVIVTDGVFSMDGEIAHLKEICDLAQKYDALVFVDDCHATGILGLTGRGTPELFGVQVDFLNSTLGKALGGAAGGYTVSNHASAIKILRNKSRPYLFSNTLAPSLVGIGIKAFDLLLANPFEDARAYQARIKLFENTQFVRYTLDKAGFILKGSNHPIIPIMIGDAKLAKLFAENLFEKRGILAVPFSFPVVPNGQARIRLQISAGHPKRDLEMAVDAIISEGKALQIIK